MAIINRNDGNELTIIKYYDNFFDDQYYTSVLDWANSLHYHKGIKNNGKKIDREQIWFDNNNNYFCKLWKSRQDRWNPHKYDTFLTEIQNKIIVETSYDVDTCLVNKYNTGKDIISRHKDNIISFGEYPNILIYSLGSERQLQLNSDIDDSKIIFNLKPNSLFIMSGASQKYFTHELLPNKRINTRYSLTFRKFIDQ
jgi:alkylated DNA repair dioxygenase AlkB